MTLPELPGVLSPAQIQSTADAIVEQQQPDGMILWFPGGHADPWNHTEAAMALSTAGRWAEHQRAFEWLAATQHDDGGWFTYYLVDGIEDPRRDTNVSTYVAVGVWHHWLRTGDRAFVEWAWPMVDKAMSFALGLQQPGGEVLWSYEPDGRPGEFALLTGSSSVFLSLRAAIAVAGVVREPRPEWELAATRLGLAIAHRPSAFEPKHRWAMDWYYPVLAGVVVGDAGRERLAARFDRFVDDGHGVRCVNDRPWITVAETCECAIAHLAVGEIETAERLFSWTWQYRHDDDRYWTGTVYPDEARFPAGERSTYTAASVVLCHDAITGGSAASKLFTDTSSVLPELIGDAELEGEPSRD
jgi:hypothetical protein